MHKIAFIFTIFLSFLTKANYKVYALDTSPLTDTEIEKLIQKVLPGIQAAQSGGITPIIRIGVHTDSAGMDNPDNLIKFIKTLDTKISGTTYVVAGPNEPETELWASPGCSDGQSSCIGPKISTYMNKIISGASGTQNIKLMSPVFNLCSPVFPGLIKSMTGANWGGLDAIGVNAYNGTPVGAEGNINTCLNNRLPLIPSNLPVIITETGAFNKDKSAFNTEIANLPQRVIGALLFNGYNTNPDWEKFSFDENEIKSLCASNACKNKRIGINFATNYSNGDYSRAAKDGMKFTLEILSGGGAPTRTRIKGNPVPPLLSRGGILPGGSKSLRPNPKTIVNYLEESAYLFDFRHPANVDGLAGQTLTGASFDPDHGFCGLGYIAGPCGKHVSGPHNPDEVRIINPGRKIAIHLRATDPNSEIKEDGSIEQAVNGPAPHYYNTYEWLGSGPLGNTISTTEDSELMLLKSTQLKGGFSSRGVPYKNLDDHKINDWLCRLGASNLGTGFLNKTGKMAVNDVEIGFSNTQTVDTDFKKQSNGEIDKLNSNNGKVTPYRASALYCYKRPSCDGTYGPQDPSMCTPGSFLPIGSEQLYQDLKEKFRLQIWGGDEYAQKTFIETCRIIDDRYACEGVKALSGILGNVDETASNQISHTDFYGMDYQTRNNILRLFQGNYYVTTPNKDGSTSEDGRPYGICSRCAVRMYTSTNLARAAGSACSTSNQGTPYKTQLENEKNKDKKEDLNFKDEPLDKIMTNQDQNAPMGQRNEIDPEKHPGQLIYTAEEKRPTGLFQAIINGLWSLTKGIICPPVTADFGEGELGSNQDGSPSTAQTITFPLCSETKHILTSVTVITSKATNNYYNCTKNISNYLTPYKGIVETEKEIKEITGGKKDLIDGTDMTIQGGTCSDSTKSTKEYALSWLLGKKDLEECNGGIDQPPEKTGVGLGKSPEPHKWKAMQYATPLKFQKELLPTKNY